MMIWIRTIYVVWRSVIPAFAVLGAVIPGVVSCAAPRQYGDMSVQPITQREHRPPLATLEIVQQFQDTLEVPAPDLPLSTEPTIMTEPATSICFVESASTDTRYIYETDKARKAYEIIAFIQKDIVQRTERSPLRSWCGNGVDVSRYDYPLQERPGIVVIYPRTHEDQLVMSSVADYFRLRGYFTNYLPEEGLGPMQRNMKLLPLTVIGVEQEARCVVYRLEEALAEYGRQAMSMVADAADEAIFTLTFNHLDTPGLGRAVAHHLRDCAFVTGKQETYVARMEADSSSAASVPALQFAYRIPVDLRATYEKRLLERRPATEGEAGLHASDNP